MTRRRVGPPEPLAAARRALVAELARLCASASAALQRGDAAGARETAADAARLARRLRDPELEGNARLIYGCALGFSGSVRAGLGQIDRAEHLLDGAGRGRVLVQRAALLSRLGEAAAALEACDQALHLLPEDAEHDRAQALDTAGAAHLCLGQPEQACIALAEAEALHRRGHRPARTAHSHANLAVALARGGDLVGALRSFGDVERELRALGLPEGQHAAAKADVLLDAGLLRDVRRELPAVIAALDASGTRVPAAECQLSLALGLVGLGDPLAADAADDARRRFHRAGTPGREAIAGLVEVRARWLAGDTSEAALAAARRTVTSLEHRGLHPYLPEARLLCGRLAMARGRVEEARRRLGEVATGRSDGTVRRRAVGWEALARLRLLDGSRGSAVRAAEAGLRVIERHRDAIGAADLRTGAPFQGVELAALGLHLALEGRDPPGVLRWAERLRAGALYRRPVLPPADPVVATLLAELRHKAVTLRTQAATGPTDPNLELEMARLEHAIGRAGAKAAQALPVGVPVGIGTVDVDELQASLGSRALIELVEAEGELAAVVLDEDDCTVHHLGALDVCERRASALVSALRTLARLSARSPAAPAGLADFRARLGELRDALVLPLVPRIGERELVVVPTGGLHALPWQLLVGAGRVAAVAPSAARWQQAERVPLGHGPVVAVAGPGLPGAEREIEAVRRHHAGAVTLTGVAATVEAVTVAVDGARLVHLVARSDLRDDSPLFSSFRLADGPQAVYDLERLSDAPGALVLSATSAPLGQAGAGEELLGLVTSLLDLGTRSVVAGVLPLPDMLTAPLMDRLHERLASGASPGPALASAAAQADPQDPGATAAAAAFVCLGAA